MKIIDLHEKVRGKKELDEIADTIHSSKWYKAGVYFFRGSKKKIDFDDFKILDIKTNRNRTPADIPQEDHDKLNTLYKEKFGIPLRNGLFLTKEKRTAFNYGNTYIIFPLDDARLFFDPEVKDMFVSYSNDTYFLERHLKRMSELTPESSKEIRFQEIIGFGKFVVMTHHMAHKLGLVADEGSNSDVELPPIDKLTDSELFAIIRANKSATPETLNAAKNLKRITNFLDYTSMIVNLGIATKKNILKIFQSYEVGDVMLSDRTTFGMYLMKKPKILDSILLELLSRPSKYNRETVLGFVFKLSFFSNLPEHTSTLRGEVEEKYR